MFSKKQKQTVEGPEEKLIDLFPKISLVRDNFVEVVKLQASTDTEEKLLQINPKFNQTSNFQSGKLLTAFETADQKTNQHKATQLDNNGFILQEHREKRSRVELCCWYCLSGCFG